MKNKPVLFLTQSAAIAAVYVVITMLFAPISFGQSGIDIRISEALTVLPAFTPAAVPGLFIGCVIANITGGGIIWDIIFGSLATLSGAFISWKIKDRRWLVPVPAIVANTLVVPFVLRYGYGVNLPLPLLIFSVGAGELLSAGVLGQILITVLNSGRKNIFSLGD